jgi:hypothetical protein
MGRFERHQVVSLDEFRLQCTDDMADQSATAAVVALRDIVVDQRLRRGLVTVADATNAKPEHRRELLSLARVHRRPIVGVLFHTPLVECICRQADRWPASVYAPGGRAVPTDIILGMFVDIGWSWASLAREVDCVVHVSPDGTSAMRVGDIPAPGGARAGWLDEIPAIPSADHLPWTVPYGR